MSNGPRIIDNREPKMLRFRNISNGDTFLHASDLFMKVDRLLAVNLHYGYLTGAINENDLVHPVDVTIIIGKSGDDS